MTVMTILLLREIARDLLSLAVVGGFLATLVTVAAMIGGAA